VLVFYGLGFGWRRHRAFPFRPFRAAPPRSTLPRARRGTVAEAALAAVAPRRLPDLLPLPPAAAAALRVTGSVLVLGATALMLVAQLDLGASWRVGIDEGARPGLVTGGLYR